MLLYFVASSPFLSQVKSKFENKFIYLHARFDNVDRRIAQDGDGAGQTAIHGRVHLIRCPRWEPGAVSGLRSVVITFYRNTETYPAALIHAETHHLVRSLLQQRRRQSLVKTAKALLLDNEAASVKQTTELGLSWIK